MHPRNFREKERIPDSATFLCRNTVSLFLLNYSECMRYQTKSFVVKIQRKKRRTSMFSIFVQVNFNPVELVLVDFDHNRVRAVNNSSGFIKVLVCCS